MNSNDFSPLRRLLGSFALVGTVLVTGILLAAWKSHASRPPEAGPPEMAETVGIAVAEHRDHRATTTAIGTVLAMESITLRTEASGTVVRVSLVPGRVVEAGALLVALDVSVEEADLKALEAQARLAETTLARLEQLRHQDAIAQDALDQAQAQRDVAQAQVARVKAVIAKKTLRAPFRARVGLADVHPGQYLNEGATVTTLQGVSSSVHVDFEATQDVAAALSDGSEVEVVTAAGASPQRARVVAVDARVDPSTRNATVRARLDGSDLPAPGSSVRVEVPVGPMASAVAVPVSALRKGPGGDHVWVITPDKDGKPRAHERRVVSGAVSGDTVIVLSGLETGEKVAAAGSFKLREGLLVKEANPVAAR